MIRKRRQDFENTEYKLDHWLRVAKGEYNIFKHVCEGCRSIFYRMKGRLSHD
jgi:hypothetical protein